MSLEHLVLHRMGLSDALKGAFRDLLQTDLEVTELIRTTSGSAPESPISTLSFNKFLQAFMHVWTRMRPVSERGQQKSAGNYASKRGKAPRKWQERPVIGRADASLREPY